MSTVSILSSDVEVIQTPQQDNISVFFKRNIKRPHMFFCVNCGTPLFQYQGQVVSLVPGNANENELSQKVIQFPIIIRCKHGKDRWGKCNTDYVLEGWAL